MEKITSWCLFSDQELICRCNRLVHYIYIQQWMQKEKNIHYINTRLCGCVQSSSLIHTYLHLSFIYCYNLLIFIFLVLHSYLEFLARLCCGELSLFALWIGSGIKCLQLGMSLRNISNDTHDHNKDEYLNGNMEMMLTIDIRYQMPSFQNLYFAIIFYLFFFLISVFFYTLFWFFVAC